MSVNLRESGALRVLGMIAVSAGVVWGRNRGRFRYGVIEGPSLSQLFHATGFGLPLQATRPRSPG